MALPGSGLVGYFGYGNEGSGNTSGMGLTGHLNTTVSDWITGPTARPQSIVGRGVTLPDGTRIPGVLSTICELEICPAELAKMNAATSSLKASPGVFNIGGNNCSTNACSILGAGGTMSGGIADIDNPQHLLDQLKRGYNTKCYNGYTSLDGAGNVTILYDGPAPAPSNVSHGPRR